MQEPVWIQKAYSQEQIVLQKPRPCRYPPPRLFRGQARGPIRPAGREQTCRAQKLTGSDHISLGGSDRGFGRHRSCDGVNAPQRPAGQDFELQPSDPKETMTRGIVERPGRRTVARGGTWEQLQIFPQRRQRGRIPGRVTQSANHCRIVAMGRRSSQTTSGRFGPKILALPRKPSRGAADPSNRARNR